MSERPAPSDDDLDDEDVILDDPEQEAFLRRLDAARATFIRGLYIAFPLWLVLLLLMSVAFRGPSLPGFLIATLAAAGGVLRARAPPRRRPAAHHAQWRDRPCDRGRVRAHVADVRLRGLAVSDRPGPLPGRRPPAITTVIRATAKGAR